MPAGTIAILETTSDPLETASQDGELPALDVRNTQEGLDGSSVQSGVAADTVADQITEVEVAPNGKIITTAMDTGKTVATEWIADVTDGGFVVAESLSGSGDFAFPLNLITAQTGARTQLVELDLNAVVAGWDDDMLMDTWMVGTDEGDRASINYHGAANRDDAPEANIGLGFELRWNGTIAKGVVYESGYVAIWEEWTAPVFAAFVEQELLPHAEPVDGDDPGEQATL